MPVEGLEPATPATPNADAQPTPDAAVINTSADATGTGTDTAQPNQAQPEPTFTQAQVNAMIAKRLPSAVKAELKKMSGDEEGKPSVEDLQRQLSEQQIRVRSFEAKETVDEYLSDGRNKLSIEPKNLRGIQELVIPRLEYGDDGKPTNLREAIESAKQIAPVLFTNGTSNINANAGKNPVTTANMNDLIRQQAGYGN